MVDCCIIGECFVECDCFNFMHKCDQNVLRNQAQSSHLLLRMHVLACERVLVLEDKRGRVLLKEMWYVL